MGSTCGADTGRRRYLVRLGLLSLVCLLSGLSGSIPGGRVARAADMAQASAPAESQAGEKRSILVLHSYHQGYKWTDDIMSGILDGLGQERENVELQIEYMDTKRNFDEQYLRQLHDLYAFKFHDQKFDLIISSDDEAFNFLLQYRDELFPGTPVVFCGVNFFRESTLAGHRLFTGVNEEADVKSGLDLALRLHPDTKLVAIVNDATTTGLKMHDVLTQVVADYRDRIDFVFLEHVNLEDVQDTIRVLPPDSLVYYTLFFRDKSDKFVEYNDSIHSVTSVSQVPVYGTWDFDLGYGIVGGMLASGYYQGETAAGLALRILNGEDPDSIPVVMDSPNRYMFDYTQLERFDIPLSSLPPDSIIINQPISFYQRYQGWIWGGGALVVGLMSIILVLASINVRRRQAESALRVSNVQLEESRALLEQRVVERTAALDRRSSQLEAAAQVARDAAAIRDVEMLLEETVMLVSERMGFYHAGIFLMDGAGAYAVLRAASSEGGRQMLADGYQLAVGQRGIVGRVAETGQPRIALDVGQDAVFFENPYLPQTRSEMALPLLIRGKVVGVLDVQSTAAEAFSEEDVAILQTLADQVSLAIENARLFKEAQDRLREIGALVREQQRRGWIDLAADRPAWGYVYDGADVALRDAVPAGQPSPQLTVALQTQDEVIGELSLALKDRPPTSEEKEVVQAVANRVSQALERARLFQETQRRAAREQLLRQISASIRAAVTIEDAVQRTLVEMSRVLDASEMVARIGTEEELIGSARGVPGSARGVLGSASDRGQGQEPEGVGDAGE